MLFYINSLVYASRGLRITEAGSRPTGLYEASTVHLKVILFSMYDINKLLSLTGLYEASTTKSNLVFHV